MSHYSNPRATKDPSSNDHANWVDPEALRIQSTIVHGMKLKNTLTFAALLQPLADPKTVTFGTCDKFERVCLSKVEGEEHFFYVYETFFVRLGLRLPFSEFQLRILNEIHVPPTQLHPNAWAFVRSFELLCQSYNRVPSVSAFFYFFKLLGSDNKKKRSWVSLYGRQGRKILNIFEQSYKNFKNHFFRVEGGESSTPFFIDENGKPKFPLYWTKCVHSPDAPVFSKLSSYEQALVKKLGGLEPKNCADLIRCSHVPLKRPLFVLCNQDMSLKRHLKLADLRDLEESEWADQRATLKMKRALAFEFDSTKQTKKQQVSVENSPPPGSPLENAYHATPVSPMPMNSTPQETSVANLVVEFEHLHVFDAEGPRITSLWDRRFNFNRHVREHLCFRSDLDKLRRTGYEDVGRFINTNALRITTAVEFLVEQVQELNKEKRAEDNEVVEYKDELNKVKGKMDTLQSSLSQSKSEVTRLCTELEKEKIARVKAEGKLWEEKVARNKAEGKLARVEGQLAAEKNAHAKTRRDCESTESYLVREWKKSVTGSFKNAIDQVRLAFPKLDFRSIKLDPYKVVEGDKLVDRPQDDDEVAEHDDGVRWQKDSWGEGQC